MATGRKLRILTIVDTHSRYAPATDPRSSYRGEDVVQTLERKVEIVDKQAGYFGDAIHKLEQKIDTLDAHEDIIKSKIAQHADTDLISTAKTEALVSHAEDLLTQMSILAGQLAADKGGKEVAASQRVSLPQNMTHFSFNTPQDGEIRYH